MRHSLPALDSLKVFEAAARLGSFTLAADELCLSKGAVSYQIKKLEQQTGCKLFLRSIRQVQLTDAGHTLLATTQQLFRELATVFAKLQSEHDRVTVNIAATTYVAARWLSSRISLFNEQYPHIEISLQHSVNDTNFELDKVDLAIRWDVCNNREDRCCIGELPLPLYPAVSPVLIARHGITTSPALPAKHLFDSAFQELPLLSENRTQDLWQEWAYTALGGNTASLPNPRRIISDANVRVQAAIDGQGMILADDLMRREMQRGLLTTPFANKLSGYGYRFLSAPNEHRGSIQETLRDWVVGSLLEIERFE